MKELTITISGLAATGKSTMLLLLEEFLKEKGFNVEMDIENEILDYGTESKFRSTCSFDWEEKLNHLKARRKIILNTAQTWNRLSKIHK